MQHIALPSPQGVAGAVSILAGLGLNRGDTDEDSLLSSLNHNGAATS